jgi:hypothetical protein
VADKYVKAYYRSKAVTQQEQWLWSGIVHAEDDEHIELSWVEAVRAGDKVSTVVQSKVACRIAILVMKRRS